MRLFVIARDNGGLRAVLVLRMDDLDRAEAERAKWRLQGYEATTVVGTDLHDVMQTHPSWFEGVAA